MEMPSSLFLLLPLLLQLFASVSCEDCPPAEDIAPCKCVYFLPKVIEIRCENVSIKDVSRAFDNLRRFRVTNAIISGVTADFLPSLLFFDVCVVNLRIHDCDLKRLSDSERSPPLLGLENCLGSLTVYRSVKGDNQLNTLTLSHLKNLNYLSLSGNNIPKLGDDWFEKGPDSLRTLKLENCGIMQLGDKAFIGLRYLEKLSLSGNRHITIKNSMLGNAAYYLQFLDLSRTNFTSLPENFFTNMGPIRMVFLTGNDIKRLEEKTWSSVWEKLQVIDIDDNPLECDSHMEWMFSFRHPNRIYGTCRSPELRKGENLLHFIESRRA